MPQPAGVSRVEHFAALEDPRQAAKVLYPLPEILLLLLSATLAGADDCVEIELWGREQLAFLRRFLPYKHGIPSHDTLTGVLAALDPAFDDEFWRRVENFPGTLVSFNGRAFDLPVLEMQALRYGCQAPRYFNEK